MLLFPYLLSIYLSFGGGNLIKNHRNKGERKEMDKEKRRNGGRETQLERGREGERDRDTKREKREREREGCDSHKQEICQGSNRLYTLLSIWI